MLFEPQSILFFFSISIGKEAIVQRCKTIKSIQVSCCGTVDKASAIDRPSEIF